MDYFVHCYRSWLNIVQNPKFLNVFSSKFSFESQITLKFSQDLSRCSNLLSMSLPILHLFIYFWVNDLNLCSRLHCIVIDYKYFLHELPMNSDYHNWVLSKFSYKHSLSFCIIMCMFVFFVLIIILVWLLRKCRDKFWIFI